MKYEYNKCGQKRLFESEQFLTKRIRKKKLDSA